MEKPSGDTVTIKNLLFTPFFTPLKNIHHFIFISLFHKIQIIVQEALCR